MSSDTLSRYLQQLGCRAIHQIIDIRWLSGGPIRGLNGSNLQQVVQDNLRDFIQCQHDKIEGESTVPSFLDVYDVFTSGVIYILLSTNSFSLVSDLSEFTSKCSTILTIMCQIFRPLNTLRKYLWATHSAAVARLPSPKLVSDQKAEKVRLNLFFSSTIYLHTQTWLFQTYYSTPLQQFRIALDNLSDLRCLRTTRICTEPEADTAKLPTLSVQLYIVLHYTNNGS